MSWRQSPQDEPMSQRRILLVGHSPHLHGAEYSLLRLAKELQNEYELAVLAPAGGAFEEAIRQLNINFFAFSPNYPFGLLHEKKGVLPAFILQFSSEWNRLKYSLPKFDLVHSNTMYVWEGAALAVYWGVPHVWNLREIPQASPTWRPALGWSRTFELLGLLSDQLICVSEALLSALPESLQNKSCVVHNGLDSKNLWSREDSRRWMGSLGIPENAKVALTIGNFIPEKGHAQLLDICADLLHKYPDWHLLWVGERHFMYSEIQQKIQSLGLETRIHCPGSIAQMGQKMGGADLYILPSLTEAFPTVLLEGRGAGVPFLASDCGGAREIAVHGGGECWHSFSEAKAKCEKAFRGTWAVPPLTANAFSMASMAMGYKNIYDLLLTEPINSDVLKNRQVALNSLLELKIDGEPLQHLLNKVDRLKSIRFFGRFFRRYFNST